MRYLIFGGFVIVVLLMGQGCPSKESTEPAPSSEEILASEAYMEEVENGDEILEEQTAGNVEVVENTTENKENNSVIVPEPTPVATPQPKSEPASSEATKSEPEPDQPTGTQLNMESGNFFFSPNVINAEPGQTVTVTVSENTGFHTFVIDEIGINTQLSSGQVFTFTAPSEPGSYEFYCDVGSHHVLGMEGVLLVQ